MRMIPRQHPVVKAVASALRHHCKVAPHTHLLVAVSGGADSVALLRALHLLSLTRPWQLRLTVAHVQHHLRPPGQTQGDARFVKRLAKQLHLPYLQADLDPASWHGNIEAHARFHRYHALFSLAHAHGAAAIVTAHHGDDQLETLLMRLLRGTGVRGLSGMAWRRRLSLSEFQPCDPSPHASVLNTQLPSMLLIRPMLGVDHLQLCDFLRMLQQHWREDATNRDLSRWRARLRHQVLPVLRELRPGIAQSSTRLAIYFRQLDHLMHGLRKQALEHVNRQGQALILPRATARGWSILVLAEVLRYCLQIQGVPPDQLGHRKLQPLLRAVRDTPGGKRIFQFPGPVTLELTRDILTIQ